jgi:demethoxyubiquinone hydroxylase (CLK1/Coq7/Cat5 family)
MLGCSLLGEKGAMACTVAVEALVTKHYDDQVLFIFHSFE